MKARLLPCPAGAFRRLAREESGVALMMTLGVFLLLYILCCGVYATGEIIRQKQELQNACDAAAYSAALVQADAFSRMAVVNRAMAWTYIQLCREQMDYITFAWLRLTCDRFEWDRDHKARLGGLDDKRHYTFKDFYVDAGLYGAGLRHYRRDVHKDLWYCGVGNTLDERHQQHVNLNGRTDFASSVAVEDIKGVLDEVDKTARAVYGKKDFLSATAERIEAEKKLIFAMNATLAGINHQMGKAIEATIPYVLYLNLPRNSEGQLSEDEIGDFYWSAIGGASPAPEAYSGLLPPQGDGEDNLAGSYYSALGNTEEDEIKFLTMADGIPGRAAGAPGWMGKRPAMLSDYFGFGDNPTESGDDLTRYVAGGLDQWYVRGSREEALDKRLNVPKQLLDPPGGIMRVYKHTNREEAATDKFGLKFHRPNHIFSLDANRLFGMSAILGDFLSFGNPFAGGVNSRVRDLANSIVQGVMGPLQSVIGELGGIIGQLGGLERFSADILPSDQHTLEHFPDQCRNVNESTGLVAQYEWSSAYWMCPWVKWTTLSGTTHLKEFGCFRLPVAALKGCDMHGYKPWLKELDFLRPREGMHAGARREEYRSCFINFDDTQNPDENHYLKGYARIYGDDEEIFDEECYIGERACPWVLSPAFFDGDGTILVGFARKQTNPFARLLAKGVSVARPSLYEPFSPQPGGDRYLVAFSAARAAWAHRPDNAATGLESVNAPEKPVAPGKYDIRFDWVTEHKNVSGSEHELTYDFGCVCGEKKTQDRLLRMWNLSQTDWDATLLPLRHAFCGYLGDLPHYDSYENPDIPTVWDYRDEKINAVRGTAERVMSLTWQNGADLVESQLPGSWTGPRENPASLSSRDILSISVDRLTEMFVHRRLL